MILNDVHSRLNPTRVRAVVRPATLSELAAAVRTAAGDDAAMAIGGGGHSMGGQQFADDAVVIDTRGLDRVVAFDRERGLIAVEAGIQWPDLVAYLAREQAGMPPGATTWGIVQKQTGADQMTLAGALSCNAHGRGLTLGPIVQQVESFDLMDQHGEVRTCSRTEHRDVFALAIGGYGLFGVITRVVLRLRPRVKVRRVVTLEQAADVMARFDQRIRDGFLYGDFQFAIDDASESFLRQGVFSCYEPVDADTPLTADPAGFQPDEWLRLVNLAHHDKTRAFDLYSSRYLETSGQIYWSDAQLTSTYVAGYHERLDESGQVAVTASEMITELFVPRPRLAAFLEAARGTLIRHRADVIYGTVRLIEPDDETFLAWARVPFACVVFNLHVEHTPSAIEAAAATFQALIDLAIDQGGSYYLTYHRWARRDQVETCYPMIRAFLQQKRAHDPDERFQSTWYRHYRDLFMESRVGEPP